MIALDLLILAGIAGPGCILLAAALPVAAVASRDALMLVGGLISLAFVAGVLALACGGWPAC